MAARQWYKMKVSQAKASAAEIVIYDEIGRSFWGEDTVSAKQFLDDLKALGEVTDIDLRINSPGGDVFDGIAIHNAIANHKATVTAYVDGIAASAASFIAMAANEIVMPSNSFLLVHGASGMAWGDAETLKKTAEDLERINASLTATYVARSGKSTKEVEALMKEDRLMDAAEALAFGLCDKVTDPVKMAAKYSLKLLPQAAADKIKAVAEKETEEAPPPPAVSEGTGDASGVDPVPAPIAEPGAPPPAVSDPTAAKVIDIDAARNEGIRQHQQYVDEVHDLCALAGAPEKAAGFIKARAKAADIRASLINTRASSADINPHNPGNPSLAQAPAAAWGKVAEALNKRVK